MTSPSPFLTVTEAAAESGLSKRRVRNAIRKGHLSGTKPGGQTNAYIIERAAFKRWLDQTTADATA